MSNYRTGDTVDYRDAWGTPATGTIEGTHHQTGELLIRDHTTNRTVYIPHTRITHTGK